MRLHREQPKQPGSAELEVSIRTLLADDHQRLDHLFEAIVAAASRDDTADLREDWSTFERALLRHLDAEEVHLLRVFAQHAPEEARGLTAEHAEIREKLTELGVDLDLHSLKAERVGAFVGQLRAHARREESLIYPWAARQLGEEAHAGLRRALEASGRSGPAPAVRSEWRIDPQRSHLRFSLRHIVVHEIRGSFERWGGTIVLDERDAARSRAEVWIDLGSVDTGERERDDHVRSAEFFDVARFPQARFASTEVRLLAGEHPVVLGRLDLHGIEAEVELTITARERFMDALGVERAIYTAKTRLDRRDFGLRWNQDLDVGGIVVGDQIEIVAHVEAVRV